MNSYQSKYIMLIEYLGGQSEAARILGCTQPSVWAWIQGKANMSAKFAVRAEQKTNGKFLKEDLCPSLTPISNIDSTTI